jgi:hypothetical protein
MYSIEPYELGIACIVFTLYISGKVWMYYNHNDRDTKPKGIQRIKSGRKSKSKKGLIRRGPEWPE